MTRIERRSIKYADKPNSAFSSVRPYFIYPLTVPFRSPYMIFNVCHNFFILQYKQLFHLIKKPLIYVNNKIDELVPFTPSYVQIYLSFVKFFITPLDLIYKRLGFWHFRIYASRTVKFMARLYKNASTIYKFCMTTTPRPEYKEMKEFRTIHRWDPHYLCVPSLHVAIAAGVYAWYTQMFEDWVKKGFITEAEAKRRSEEYRRQGIKIIESVLFVKQHSVNCIPTALYMISKTMCESKSEPIDFHEYITDIFAEVPELTAEAKTELQNYFIDLYDQLLQESQTTKNWQEPIKNWLKNYAAKTNQIIKTR